MRNGDISNEEAGRLWFVAEGLVLLPIKHGEVPRTLPLAARIGLKRSLNNYLRSSFELSTWAHRRMWDLVWRLDFKLGIVTFNTTPEWHEVLQTYLDEYDMPAPLRAYSFESFMDSVVTLPSCLRVYDADPSRALTYGRKGTFVDPNFDFQPLEA